MINRIGKQEKHILCSAKLGFDFQKKKKKTLALFFCEWLEGKKFLLKLTILGGRITGQNLLPDATCDKMLQASF